MGVFEDVVVPWIFDAEGGYVDNAVDHGGTTKYGISLRYLRECADGDIDRDGDVDADDVRVLTREDALRLYRRDYWQVNGCEVFPAALGLCLFDAAAHHGGQTARKLIQQGLGCTPDGIFGTQTLAAVRASESDPELQRKAIAEYAAQRAARFCRIVVDDRSQATFMMGWYRRLMRLVTTALGVV